VGVAGAAGGAFVGRRIGSTVIRRDGPGIDERGRGARDRGMDIT
jgi:hypothetical protein